MRIRSIKPEFWRSDDVNEIPWEMVYNGRKPDRMNTIAPMKAGVDYVYMIFGNSDELLYIGRSFRPADRFSKHCRRKWWGDVDGVAIFAVQDEVRMGVRRSYYTPPNVSRFESAAISALHPTHNITGRRVN